MDCVREAENYLRYYRDLLRSLDHASTMISRLKWETAPKDSGAASTDATGIHADKPVNTLNQFYQLQKWIEMRELTEIKIVEIDKVLDEIAAEGGCERYKEILILWYVEKHDKDEIKDIFNYSSRQSVYDLKDRAIKKFAVNLFGIEALEAI